MAVALAQSLRLHCDHIPRAVVTDAIDDARLRGMFDIVVPLDPELGAGMEQKLHLDRYSPFEATLFIDSDSIVVRNVDEIWELFADTHFGVEGCRKTAGFWFGDIGTTCRRAGVSSLPQFNGGMYWFTRDPRTDAVFATARAALDRYAELGLRPMRFRGTAARPVRAEEPLVAVAMAVHGIEPQQDHGRSMRTPVNRTGWLSIDVLQGRCRFVKEGRVVEPAIVHFCGLHARGFHYRRERLKLELATRTGLPHVHVSRAVNALTTPVYRLAEPAALGLLGLVRARWRTRRSWRRWRTRRPWARLWARR